MDSVVSLLDRMRAAKSGMSTETARRIVDVVRGIRDAGIGAVPTVRASIMIAKLVGRDGMKASASDAAFRQTCFDVLAGRASEAEDAGLEQGLTKLIEQFC